MNNNENIPKLRFKEFENADAWEQCALGEMIKTSSFKAYLSEASEIGTYPVIQQGDNPILGFSNNKPFKEFEDVVLFGDHTLSLYKPIFPFLVATDGLKILSINGFGNNFLYALLEKYMPESEGDKRHFTILKSSKISFPQNRDERELIGLFFTSLDQTIAIQQRKLEKTKTYKKTMLSKMFPKNGETVPEIRFDGFTDAWEQRECGEVCSISTGKGNTQDKEEGAEYPFYVRSPIIERSSKYLYDEEAVLTVGDGVGTGKVYHYVNGKYNLHQRVYRMYGFDKGVLGKYFYIYFSQNFYKRVHAMTAKTSVDSVRLDMIVRMSISFPSIGEQKKISDFFFDLDQTITFQQRKLQTLKNMKKTLLAKMFV